MFKKNKGKTGIDRERLAVSLYEKEAEPKKDNLPVPAPSKDSKGTAVSKSKTPADIEQTKSVKTEEKPKINPEQQSKEKKKNKDKSTPPVQKTGKQNSNQSKPTIQTPPAGIQPDPFDSREEIFSTATKTVRLTKQNPLDVQAEEDKQSSNTRELFEILEFLDKVQDNNEKKQTGGETNAAGYEIHDGEIPMLQNTIELERIQEISRQLHEENAERQRAKHDSDDEKTLIAPKHKPSDKNKVVPAGSATPVEDASQMVDVSKLQPEPELPVISISVGKFSQVVRSQYEEYVNVNKHKAEAAAIAEQNGSDDDNDDEPVFRRRKPAPEKQPVAEKPVSHNIASKPAKSPKGPRTYITGFEEFTSKSSPKEFFKKLSGNMRGYFARSIALSVLTIITALLFIFEKFSPQLLNVVGDKSPLLFCTINLAVIIIAGIISAETIVSGFKGIVQSFGNSDTAVSLAFVAVGAQGVAAMLGSNLFFNGSIKLYSSLLILALFFNSLGKYKMFGAARTNFMYIASPKRKYAVKKYDDKYLKAKMLSGVSSDKNTLAYQKRTSFISGFFRNQYRSDRGTQFINRLSLPLILLAALASTLYGLLLGGGLYGGLSAFAVISLAAVPMSGFAAVQWIIKKVCKFSLKSGAMITGYSAYKSFSSCGAIMTDIRTLYPRGALSLQGIKTFDAQHIDEAIINAAAVASAAGGPMADVFSGIVKGNLTLPVADSVIYEDEKGLIGWVNGERVLVGSSVLLNEHGIDTPSKDYEDKYTSDGSCITYVANAGLLVAMFITMYRPEARIARAMQALEDSQTAILVRTVDENITAEKIANDFGLYHRSIKILPTGLGNVLKQESAEEDEKTDAKISTSGSFISYAHGVANSKRMGSCVRLMVTMQMIALILGVFLVTLLVFCAGIGRLGVAELLLYFLFCAIAMFISPLFVRN